MFLLVDSVPGLVGEVDGNNSVFGCFRKIMVPPNHPWINRVFHYKPSILGGFPPIFGNTHINSSIC